VSDGGRFQLGHSQADRPDVPQGTVLPAVLEPVGMPLATAGVSGERADAPRSMPCSERVQASVGQRGWL
jgi:transposase